MEKIGKSVFIYNVVLRIFVPWFPCRLTSQILIQMKILRCSNLHTQSRWSILPRYCPTCSTEITLFPPYNSPRKLLEMKRDDLVNMLIYLDCTVVLLGLKRGTFWISPIMFGQRCTVHSWEGGSWQINVRNRLMCHPCLRRDMARYLIVSWLLPRILSWTWQGGTQGIM